MSDILKSYFYKRNNNSLPSRIKYFSLNKDFQKYENYGLFLTDNNILKMKNLKYPKYNIKYKTINLENNKDSLPTCSKTLFLNKFHNKFINSNLNEKNNHKDKCFNSYYSTKLKSSKSIINKENTIKTERKNLKEKTDLKINSYLDKKTKVNEILESLFNKTDKDEKLHIDKTSYEFNNTYNKNYFPSDKSIDPKNYIKYNLKTQPNKIHQFKSYSLLKKCLNNRKNNRIKNLKKYEELGDDLNVIEKFHFYQDNNENDINDLKNIKKIIFPDILKINNKKNNLSRNNYKTFKIRKTEENKNLINFYEKMNIVVNSNLNEIKYLNYLSEKNNSLIKNINIMINNNLENLK